MKYLITFVWAVLISQVTFYLGAQLTQMTYKMEHAFILALAATIVVALITKMLPPVEKASSTEEHH